MFDLAPLQPPGAPPGAFLAVCALIFALCLLAAVLAILCVSEEV